MATVTGLVSVKKFLYRGVAEEFSNDYWFSGTPPADNAAWKTLYDALVAQEKTCLIPGVTMVAGYGYDDNADSRHAVWSIDMTVSPNVPVPGTLPPQASDTGTPGDCAAWVRWKTERLNSKGKPIYLRKYFHGVLKDTGATTADNVNSAQKTALNAFGSKLRDGTFADARTLRSRLHADNLIQVGVSNYVTTRTLKRRGKRPGS